MRLFGEGDFFIHCEVNTRDESEHSLRNLNAKVFKINDLVDRVYRATLYNTTAELKAHRSRSTRIFYNTLETITWLDGLTVGGGGSNCQSSGGFDAQYDSGADD
jgi:sensor histidine kinase YesM